MSDYLHLWGPNGSYNFMQLPEWHQRTQIWERRESQYFGQTQTSSVTKPAVILLPSYLPFLSLSLCSPLHSFLFSFLSINTDSVPGVSIGSRFIKSCKCYLCPPRANNLVREVKIGQRLNKFPTQAKTWYPGHWQFQTWADVEYIIHSSILPASTTDYARHVPDAWDAGQWTRPSSPARSSQSGRGVGGGGQDYCAADKVIRWGVEQGFLEGWCLTEY